MISRRQLAILKKVINVLNRLGIKYQIHGGLAAIIYGAKRHLFDIDIDISKSDFKKVREVFERYIDDDLHHEQDSEFDLYLMTLKIDGVHVDFDQVEETFYINSQGQKVRMDPVLSKAKRVEFKGLELWVEDKEELVAYKKFLGRQEDLEDLKYL